MGPGSPRGRGILGETSPAHSKIQGMSGIWSIFSTLLVDVFCALTLLVGQQEGHPACKKLSGGLLVWLSVCSEVQTCIRPS